MTFCEYMDPINWAHRFYLIEAIEACGFEKGWEPIIEKIQLLVTTLLPGQNFTYTPSMCHLWYLQVLAEFGDFRKLSDPLTPPSKEIIDKIKRMRRSQLRHELSMTNSQIRYHNYILKHHNEEPTNQVLKWVRFSGVEERSAELDINPLIQICLDIKETDWYQKAQNQFSPFWISYRVKNPTNNEYVWRLALVRKMILVGGDKEAVVMIKVKDTYLSSRIGNQEYLTMLSVDDTPVSFSNYTKYYGTMPPFEFSATEKYDYGGAMELEGEDVLFHVSSLDISRTSSNIYLMTYDVSAIENTERIIVQYTVVTLVTMLLTMLILFFFSRSIANQVKGLRVEMGKASRGEYDTMSERIRASKELTEAFEDLLTMVKNIQTMEAAQYEAAIKEQNIQNEQQKMEFKMLASQINPHFLYNTLESIRMKAFTAGDREVATAIKLLGKSMRYVLENTGTADTTLQAEIDHILTYLKIQQLRFGDRVNYILSVEPGMQMEEYRVLPLLLQPIVENAIVHGLEAREKEGTVWISIYVRENKVFVDISDNGCGMDADTLSAIMTKVQNYTRKRHKSSIGLYNINRRIKLNYGEQYGLDIQSTLGEGTMVRVTLPVLKQANEEAELL